MTAFTIVEGDVVVRSSDGIEMAVEDATALPADTRGFISVGYDGTNTRFIRVDSSGHQYVLSNQLPAALVGGRLDTNIGAWLGSTAPTVGQKVMASSIPVVLASDQSVIPVSQNGTWTVQQGTPPWEVSQSGTWTVQQGTPPWAVEGTDANGAPPTENPVLVAGWDSTNVRIILTETDGTVRIKDEFTDDRDKVVGVNFAKTLVAATTYYEFIDLDGSSYKHNTSGTDIVIASSGGWAAKTNSGSKWKVQLMIVLAIDGTSSDLGILPLFSIDLGNTSQFSDKQFQNLFPSVLNLAVSSGDFTHIADGYKETGVTAVNTGITLDDVFGSSVTPAVGDLLLRVELISGVGTLDFAYGLQYWVE